MKDKQFIEDIKRQALAWIGGKTHQVKVVPCKGASVPAWDVYVKAQGMQRGRKAFTVVCLEPQRGKRKPK